MSRLPGLLSFTFLFSVLATTPIKSQGIQKKLTISVTDAVSGKPVEGAEITIKALIGKVSKKTNSEGKVLFVMFLLGKQQNWNYTVKYSGPSKTYKAFAGTFTIFESKDIYDLSASIQPDLRHFSFKLSDDKRQPLTNATVKLKDDKGNELSSKTDINGIAGFDVPPSANYGNTSLTIMKEGFNDYTLPVEINAGTSQVAVVAPLTAKNVIIIDNGVTDVSKQNKDLPGPTDNVIQTNLPPGYFPKPVHAVPAWGPYKPECDANPLASVPIFTSLSVEDEKTLLDNITSSCLGSAADAVNSLVDATENIITISSRLQAAWNRATDNSSMSHIIQVSQKKFDDVKNIAEEEAEKSKKVIMEAVEKTKQLLKNIETLGEGPEVFVLNCLWDGIKDYAIPGDIEKLKKSADAFGKAKKEMSDKLDSIQKRLTSANALGLPDMNLLTDWGNVIGNIQKTMEGLNMILSYVTDPKKVLPYEIQVNLAISSAESLIGSLLSDCGIRECDRQIKQGISAAQAALTAARKLSAQKLKGESKWRQIINEYVTKNFPPEDRGWEHFASNDPRMLMLPSGAYGSWVNYHNEAIDADNEAKKLEQSLTKLAELCRKIQPVSIVLNERVNKYQDLYKNGLAEVLNCKLDEAGNDVKQMKALENSDCGHFFPKPFGKAQSEELDDKIKVAKQSGRCKEKFTGKGWELESLVIDPDKRSGKWDDAHYVNITENSVTATVLKSKLVLNITSPPHFIKDGEEVKFEVTTSYEGDDDNVVLTMLMNAYGGLDDREEISVTDATVGKMTMNGGKPKYGGKSIMWVKNNTFGIPQDWAVIHAQVFINPYFEGPRIFEARYRRVNSTDETRTKKPEQAGKIKEVSEQNFEKLTGIPSRYGVFNLVENGIKKTGIAVLGKFPDYVNKGKKLNASLFVIGDKWDQLERDGYDPWKANLYFLDRVADLRQKIIIELGGKPLDAYTAKEVKYLTEQRGYKWTNDGKTLIPTD